MLALKKRIGQAVENYLRKAILSSLQQGFCPWLAKEGFTSRASTNLAHQ